MASRIVSGPDAWGCLANSDSGRWSSDIARYCDVLPRAYHQPKFALSPDETFFCIGSCFARNIEEHLLYVGSKVLSKRIVSPLKEWPWRANGFVNKFTSRSMLNEMEWTIAPPKIDDALFERAADGWLDLQLSAGQRTVTLARAIERRTYLLTEYFSRLRDSSVVVITLGLNEVWWDAKSDRYLNAAPSFFSVRREPRRYSLEIADVEANLNALEEIRNRLLDLRSHVKIIITVSPVPLSETFSGKDAMVANTLSKATLRVAAEAFANNHSDVDYFPTFEMISMSPRALAYEADCLHVTDQAVGQAVRQFVGLYMGKDVEAVPFNEGAYLISNPDDAAVRSGSLESGFEHWLKRGKIEGRPLTPTAPSIVAS